VPLSLDSAIFLSRSELRWEFFNLAVGIALLSVALSALALFFFRRRVRELTLLYFGFFVMLFALRLLSLQPSIRSLFDVSTDFWAYFDWVITCAILLPGGLFLLQVVGDDFKPFFHWLVAAQSGFALFGIVAAAFGVKLSRLHILNSIVVLAILGTAVTFSTVLRYSRHPRAPLSREVRIFIAGFVVWLLSVVHANLLGIKLLKGNGHNVEFLGFTVFVAALGYISAHRIFANEERLLTINKELEIARQIQSSILPQRLPTVRGLEIAARYLPMSAVAGDFYDFLEIDEKRIGVLIADVTGHGVPAALIAAMLKVAFVGQVANAHDPARVLTGLNTALCGKFEEHFVTATYVYLDLQQNLLRYSGAGHPPLLRSSNTARVEARGVEVTEEIEQNGLMLGLFPEAAYTSLEIALRPGDRYLLYTDGVSEAKNARQEEFGTARLLKFLETHQDGSVNRAGDDLLAEIANWSRATQNSAQPVQDDDITLLLLHVSTTV
jgi:serine phosphatase RsbU (regulator of sigma subunit)